MKIFDVGAEAHGFIAIGGSATGVIAIGQLAFGVIAIGQLARGVVAVGQLAVGIFAAGQVAVGLYFAAGFGVAGRHGFGAVLEIFPRGEKKQELPEPVELAKLLYGELEEGWLRAKLAVHSGALRVLHDNKPLALEIPKKIHKKAVGIARRSWSEVLLLVKAEEQDADQSEAGYSRRVLGISQLRAIPAPKYREGSWWAASFGRIAAISAMALIYWVVVATPLVRALLPWTEGILPVDFGVPY